MEAQLRKQPPEFWAKFLIIALFVICAIALFSCSAPKRAAKAIKRIGIEPIALEIVKNYPEYLTTDTVKIDTIINVPFEVKVPEFHFDTVTNTTIINDCNELHYVDSKISISIKNGHLSYIVKSYLIKDTAKAHVSFSKPAGLCPGVGVVKGLTKLNAKQILENNKLREQKNRWRIIAIVEAMFLILIFAYFLIRIIIWVKTLPFHK